MKSRGCYETPGGTLITGRVPRARSRSRSTARRSTTSRSSRSTTPSWSTTASGSRRCARRSTPSSSVTSANTTGEITLRMYKGSVEPVSPQVAELALLAVDRQLHHGRRLQPDRRARLHQPDRAADSDRCLETSKSRPTAERPIAMKLWGGRFAGAVRGLRTLQRVAAVRPPPARGRHRGLARPMRGRCIASASTHDDEVALS